jgi:hypothetical protein
MRPIPRLCLLAIASVVLLSGDDPSWKEKTIPQWDDQDAKQVLADSPWVKSVKLERVRDLSKFERRDGGNMSAGVPPYVGAFWFDLSALGGMFGSSNTESLAMQLARSVRAELGNVVIRWESALPVRAAEMKAGEVGAPVWDGDYYAIAVYNIAPPFHWNLANELKGLAFLQRGKKKDLKPSRVKILPHNNGLMTVVYLFPRSAPIGNDSNVRFMAQIGRLFVSQFFFPEDMQFQGKTEL